MPQRAADSWARKSVEIANQENYLDRLQAEGIYPTTEATERDLPNETVESIVRAHNNEDSESLIENLLELDKFPIDDIYVGYLRKGNEEVIENNPQTVERIANRILSMNVEEVLTRCRRPKVTNRQMGQMFHDWIKGLDYPFVEPKNFGDSNPPEDSIEESNVYFFNGSPNQMKEYANSELGCGLEIEPDVLLRIGNHHIIGEAKYLSGFGGHQNTQFDRVLDFIRTFQGDVERIAIVDGVPWLERNTRMCRKIRRITNPTMTALLFPEYLKDRLESL